MKKEHEEKLEMAKKALVRYNEMLKYNPTSHQIGREFFLKGFRFIEELIRTQDIEVLCALFDFFTGENQHNIYDALEGLIVDHFDDNAMLQAYYQKFDSFAEKDPERCAGIASVCFFSKDVVFEKFRKMFNAVKPKYSRKFLEELRSLVFAGACVDEMDKRDRRYVHTLEEDMKNW
ncbi:MAG: hypothetical protein LBE98_03195 [Puniceicoccales bacterium]|jgi:hypothetical protein|nr:hypothetical protein [Puniceicoccales bacterium]